MEELDACFQQIIQKVLERRELLGAESERVDTQLLAQRLSEELEKSDEFSFLVNTVTSTVPRYEKESRGSLSKQQFDDILFNSCKGELGSFLRRSGLYNHAITTEAIDPSDYCKRFKAEATKATCTETKLIVVDGLAGVSVKINDAVHITQFSKTELDDFFEKNVPKISQQVIPTVFLISPFCKFATRSMSLELDCSIYFGSLWRRRLKRQLNRG